MLLLVGASVVTGAAPLRGVLAPVKLDLPVFRPEPGFDGSLAAVWLLLRAVLQVDVLLWSTAVYHGTLNGATKNALDYLEFLSGRSSLDGRPVGLITVAGGDMAAVNAIDAMVHTGHAMRGDVLSLKVPIGRSSRAISPAGDILDEKARRRLEMLGELVAREARRWRDAATKSMRPEVEVRAAPAAAQ